MVLITHLTPFPIHTHINIECECVFVCICLCMHRRTHTHTSKWEMVIMVNNAWAKWYPKSLSLDTCPFTYRCLFRVVISVSHWFCLVIVFVSVSFSLRVFSSILILVSRFRPQSSKVNTNPMISQVGYLQVVGKFLFDVWFSIEI